MKNVCSRAMRKSLIAIVTLCLLAMICPSLLFGQKLCQLSLNPNFDHGKGGWNIQKAGADLIVRDWTPYFGGGLFEERLGQNLVLIKDEGSFGQTIKIPEGSRYHLLNGHAYKFAEDHSGDGGHASLAVSYYDEYWNELDKVVVNIGGKNPEKNRGTGDGLNFYSYGLYVPEGAVHAFMFVYIERGTCVYLDGFGLFDYKVLDAAPAAENLIVNPTFQVGRGGIYGFNTEFWNNVRDPANGELLFADFGSVNQPEFMYQFVDLSPRCTYTLTVEGHGTDGTPASVGIDFYDADWNPIGKRVIDMTYRGSVFDGARIIPPQGTAHSSVFVHVDQTMDENDKLSVYRIALQKQDNRLSYEMSAIINRTGDFGSGPSRRKFVRVIYNDADGVNLDCIDVEDVFCGSKSDPYKTYPAQAVYVKGANGNRVVYATYVVDAPGYLDDVGDIFFCEYQVKDIHGNYLPATH